MSTSKLWNFICAVRREVAAFSVMNIVLGDQNDGVDILDYSRLDYGLFGECFRLFATRLRWFRVRLAVGRPRFQWGL